MFVKEINLYPIKGLSGIKLNESDLSLNGLLYDR